MTRRRTANLTWQWGHDAVLVREVAEYDNPAGVAVVAMVEARTKSNDPVHVGSVVGDRFKVAQDVTNGATAGCALAVRRDGPVHLRRWRTRRASRAGRGVQQRDYLHAVDVERTAAEVLETHTIVVHNPLLSTGRQREAIETVEARADKVQRRRARVRAKMARRLRAAAGRPTRVRVVRWVVVGDGNTDPEEWRKALGGVRVFGRRPMAMVFGRGWGDLEFSAERVAHADHAVLTVDETR